MNNPKLLQQKQEIDNLFGQVTGFTGDPYVKSMLTYYLCVRISGFLENCVRTILTDYADSRTKDYVRTYVTGQFERFPNPTFEHICRTIRDFSDQWQKDFKAGIPSRIRHSLDSINVNRNAIAHGGTSTITVGQLFGYYQDVILLIEQLEQICT